MRLMIGWALVSGLFAACWATVGAVQRVRAARARLAAFTRYREGADGAAGGGTADGAEVVARRLRAAAGRARRAGKIMGRAVGKTTPPAGRGSRGRVSVEPSHGVRAASALNLHSRERIGQDG